MSASSGVEIEPRPGKMQGAGAPNGLVTTTLVIAASKVSQLLVGTLRYKLLALYFGPSGIGDYAQIVAILDLLSAPFAGLETGVTRYAAAYLGQQRRAAVGRVLLIGVVGAALTAVAVAALFAAAAAHLYGSDARLVQISQFLAISLPASVTANVCAAWLQAFYAAPAVGLATVLAYGVALATIIPSIRILGMPGAAFNVLVRSLVYLLIVGIVARRLSAKNASAPPQAGAIAAPEPTREIFSGLARYATAVGSAGLLLPFTGLCMQLLVTHILGPTANGLYQATQSISGRYLPVVLQSMLFLGLPAVSASTSPSSRRQIVNDTARFTVIVGGSMMALVLILRQQLVAVLYSSSFGIDGWIPIQILGDYAKLLTWSTGLPIQARGHLRAFLVIELVWASVQLVAGAALVVTLHTALGAIVGYVLAYFVCLIITVWFVTAKDGTPLDTSTIVVSGLMLCQILVSWMIPVWWPVAVATCLLLTCAWFLFGPIELQRREFLAILGEAASRLGRRRRLTGEKH